MDGPGPLAKKAFINGISKGRDGKVRIVVWHGEEWSVGEKGKCGQASMGVWHGKEWIVGEERNVARLDGKCGQVSRGVWQLAGNLGRNG